MFYCLLDINVSISGNRLSTSVHYKPTDSHSYLLHSSSHLAHVKNSIPYSQFLRLSRLCGVADVAASLIEVALHIDSKHCSCLVSSHHCCAVMVDGVWCKSCTSAFPCSSLQCVDHQRSQSTAFSLLQTLYLQTVSFSRIVRTRSSYETSSIKCKPKYAA